MAVLAGVAVGSAAEGPGGLVLAKCEGLPRAMLESGRVSDQVFERMDFLWRASNCLSLASPAVSRTYSDQLRKLCAQHEALSSGDGPLLPEWVSDSLCGSCGAVLTPGVNCRVRIRHRSLASPSVKRVKTRAKGKKEAKRLNEVVMTCLACGGVNARGGTERRAHDKKRRRRGGHVAGHSPEDMETPAGKKRARVATNLRGNFIPLGGTNPSHAPATINTSAKDKYSSRPSPSVPPPPKKSGGSRDGGACSSGNDSGRTSSKGRRGRAGTVARIGFSSGGGGDPTGPAAAIVAGYNGEDSRRGNNTAGSNGPRQPIGGDCGGSKGGVSVGNPMRNADGDASGGGACAGGGGGDGRRGQEVSPPALSLLERIRRDAKKKRRQDAAAATAAAVAQNGWR